VLIVLAGLLCGALSASILHDRIGIERPA